MLELLLRKNATLTRCCSLRIVLTRGKQGLPTCSYPTKEAGIFSDF
jgi:hypothetical protein